MSAHRFHAETLRQRSQVARSGVDLIERGANASRLAIAEADQPDLFGGQILDHVQRNSRLIRVSYATGEKLPNLRESLEHSRLPLAV